MNSGGKTRLAYYLPKLEVVLESDDQTVLRDWAHSSGVAFTHKEWTS